MALLKYLKQIELMGFQKYHIRTNIGEELNLADWRIIMQSPSLNFANIFFYCISIVTLVAFE